MKMQHQSPDSLTSGPGLTTRTQDQSCIIPKVRYHPTIQIQTPGRSTQPKSRTSQAQKVRPVPAHKNKTQENQDNQATPQAVPFPAVRPGPVKKPERDLVQKPELLSRSDQVSDGASLHPHQFSLDPKVPLDQSIVEQVEVLTRGQSSNPDWFTWRKNRITASVAHRIAHSRFANGKSKTPPTSYLSAVTGEGSRIQTRAMSWGINMEAKVVQKYQKLKSSTLGRPVVVQACGLFVDAQRPWLAASPDGIVTDSSGQQLLCLEVKCPYKHRHRRVEEACRDDPNFCLQLLEQDGQQHPAAVYCLKTSHSYYTQIQCQLAVTGLQHADLVVFTLKEIAIVPVAFDPRLWEDTVSRLQVFYSGAVLPRLREAAVARTPEL